jgi:hypothetical protein
MGLLNIAFLVTAKAWNVENSLDVYANRSRANPIDLGVSPTVASCPGNPCRGCEV